MKILLSLVAIAIFTVEITAETSYPKTKPPIIGVNISPPPASVQIREGIDAHSGVYVNSTFPNTAASNMGVKPGDVILSVNGTDIKSMSNIREVVDASSSGEGLSMIVSRGGEKVPLNGTFGEWPSDIPRSTINKDQERNYRNMQERQRAQVANKIKDSAKNKEDKPVSNNQASANNANSSPKQDVNPAPFDEKVSNLERTYAKEHSGSKPPLIIPNIKIPEWAGYIPAWQFDFIAKTRGLSELTEKQSEIIATEEINEQPAEKKSAPAINFNFRIRVSSEEL